MIGLMTVGYVSSLDVQLTCSITMHPELGEAKGMGIWGEWDEMRGQV